MRKRTCEITLVSFMMLGCYMVGFGIDLTEATGESMHPYRCRGREGVTS